MSRNLVARFAWTALFVSATAQLHAGVVPGSSYSVSGFFNGTSYAAATITFDGTDKSIFDGKLIVHETTHDDDAHHQWVDFSVRTADGKPYGFDPQVPSQSLNVLFTDIQFERPVTVDANWTPDYTSYYNYFSADGAAQPVTSSPLPMYKVGPHPFLPANPTVLFATLFINDPAFTVPSLTERLGTAFNGVNVLVTGGSSTTDQANFGARFTSIPEPSSLLLVVVGLSAIGVCTVSRKRIRAHVVRAER